MYEIFQIEEKVSMQNKDFKSQEIGVMSLQCYVQNQMLQSLSNAGC